MRGTRRCLGVRPAPSCLPRSAEVPFIPGTEAHFENRQLSAQLAGNIVGSRSGSSLTSIVSVGCAVDPSVSSTSGEASLARYVLRTPGGTIWLGRSPGIVVEGEDRKSVV